MYTYRMTMPRVLTICLTLVMLVGIPSVSVGQFQTTDYGGLLDTQTGLVWGKDINVSTHTLLPEMHVADFYFTEDPDADPPLPLHPEYAGGFTDWRPPTVGEVLVAIENGLLEVADFSYDPGDQPPATFGDVYYWSTCIEKYRGLNRRYKFRFTAVPDYLMESGAGMVIGVRGLPADHSNCPGRHYKPPKPRKPRKPRK